jgi:hypothetical protein
MYLGTIYIFPQGVLFGISIFLYCIRTLGSTAGAERRAGNCRQAEVSSKFPALPSTPVVEPRVHINGPTHKFSIWKITDHKWKQLILVVNFLLGLIVNEITNMTFI